MSVSLSNNFFKKLNSDSLGSILSLSDSTLLFSKMARGVWALWRSLHDHLALEERVAQPHIDSRCIMPGTCWRMFGVVSSWPLCCIHQRHLWLIISWSNVSQTWSEPRQLASNICSDWEKTTMIHQYKYNININQANTLLSMLYSLTLTSMHL